MINTKPTNEKEITMNDIEDIFGGENYNVVTSGGLYAVKASSSEDAQKKISAILKEDEEIVAVEHPTLAQVEVIDEAGYRLACE